MATPTVPGLFKINLLLRKEEQEKLYRRFIKWALSSGKFIVIIVEMITISAFVYRYKLDADLMDLQDQINQQIPYLKSLKGDELALRQTQFQLTSIKQLKGDRANYAGALTALTKITPKNITLTNVTMDKSQPPNTSVIINGQTPSNLELSVFIKELQKNPGFSDIVLTNISFEGQTIFTITGKLSDKLNRT